VLHGEEVSRFRRRGRVKAIKTRKFHGRLKEGIRLTSIRIRHRARYPRYCLSTPNKRLRSPRIKLGYSATR
jgi:hypothetical protein